MIKLEEIKKLIECSILTGYINSAKGDKIVNLLLIADIESGKSELIKIMQEYPNTYYTNDLSFKGLIDELLPKLERDEISHILIPDFINVISHRRAVETLIPVLNSIMEEGLKDLKFYGVARNFSRAIKGGIITGITKKNFENKLISWRNCGFLSRIIPITFSYNRLTQKEIHTHIKKGEYAIPEKITKDFSMFKLKQFEITIPKEIADKLEILMEQIVDRNKTYTLQKSANDEWENWKIELQKYGFRLHKQIRSLIKGICLYNAKIITNKLNYTVTNKDFEDLISFVKYINFDFRGL